MDPITSNFIINITGIAVASCIGIIGAFANCFLKSRCTNIKSPCLSCDKDVLSAENEIYREASQTFTPQTVLRK
jgi:hypothetical protein